MGLINEIVPPEKLIDRAKELADILIAASPSSQQLDARKATADFGGCGKRGRRPGASGIGKCAHSLHAGFPGRAGVLPRKEEAGVARRGIVTGDW